MNKLTIFATTFFLVSTLFVKGQAEGNFKSRAASPAPQQVQEMDIQQRAYNAPGNENANSSNDYYNKPYQAGMQFVGENVMVLNVNALSNNKAKEYVAVFNVTQAGATAEETDRLLNEKVNSFITGANALSLSRENIYVDMVSFLPRYEYVASKKVFSKKTYTEVPKGFILQKNIHVRFVNPEMLDKLITIAAKNEIYEVVKVDYTVDNPDKVYQELRNKAMDYLNQEIEAYRKIGLRLDTAYKVATENTWAIYPANRYTSYQAFSSVSMDAVRGAQIMEAEKTTTSFYNAIPADAYDIVLNPTILEPEVQYSYSLRVKFTMKERVVPVTTKTQSQKEFILVTPTGEVKTLKIDKSE